MNTFEFVSRSAIAALFCAGLMVPAAAEEPTATPSRATVSWSDPAEFAEVRDSHGRGLTKAEDWLASLKKHVERRADRVLPAGQQLEVVFTDVKLAGQFEPWRGPQFDDVRIVKDIYPPRIELRFVLKSADGSVIEQGDRKLRDLGFLTRSMANTSDPLRYEKRMLDDWINRDFVKGKT